jgi:parvulin-like peptidyl-prolyl isomerase
VRVSQFRPSRWITTIVLALVLGGALVACADDGSSASSGSNASGGANAAPAAQSSPTTLAAAAQIQPTQTPEEALAARVNSHPIFLAAFERERERRTMGLAIEPATAAAFDAEVLQTLIDQVLIEQAAESQGITVTDEEVEAELSLQRTIAEQNEMSFEEILAAQLYTVDEYQEALRDMLLAQKVSEVIAPVSPMAEQVHSRHILVADEATARMLLDQLNQGADFAQLAMQYSLDGSTSHTGGDLDWVSEGDLLQPEVEAAIFALQPGQRAPEPVRSSLGYHIVETLERVEDRPLSPAALAEKKQKAFLNWLETQRAAATIERFVGTP